MSDISSYGVKKRNGEIVDFDQDKIKIAISKAMRSVNQHDDKMLSKVAHKASKNTLDGLLTPITVDTIHKEVENALMEYRLFDVAREYITYRDRHKPDIFRKRTEIEPVEYPQFQKYIDAIHHAFWTSEEFSYQSDIQDVKVNLSETDRSIVVRAMLAISQIENSVKTFYSHLDLTLPKPEISDLGSVIADNEVRHGHSYKNLLKLLGLNDEFDKLKQVPAIQKRIEYLNETNAKRFTDNKEDFFEAIILFSMFVENVSLFSQFLILMSYNKHGNMLKGMSNVIEASSIEEDLHAKVGFELVDIMKKEHPEWWNDELVSYIKDVTNKTFEAEKAVVDWIYEQGDSQYAPKNATIEFIKYRLNDSLQNIGIDPFFDLNEQLLNKTEWFVDEILLTRDFDFFNKRGNTYNNRSKSVTSEDLF